MEDRIENYQYKDTLGSGCSGEVNLVMDRRDKKLYALKHIQTIMNDDKNEFISKYAVRELTLVSQLKQYNNPNIVNIIECWDNSSGIYIVMEYCHDKHLDYYLRKKFAPEEKFSEQKAMSFLKEIVNGYRVLYENNIVHRDIKPENILIHEDVAKVGDLGFARKMEENTKKQIIGNEMFKAPEVFITHEDTAISEVYSFALLLLRVLVGKETWDFIKSNPKAVLDIRAGEWKKYLPKNFSLSPKLNILLEGMFEPDPRKRFDWEFLFEIILKYDFASDPAVEQMMRDYKASKSLVTNLKRDTSETMALKRELAVEAKMLIVMHEFIQNLSTIYSMFRFERQPLKFVQLQLSLVVIFLARLNFRVKILESKLSKFKTLEAPIKENLIKHYKTLQESYTNSFKTLLRESSDFTERHSSDQDYKRTKIFMNNLKNDLQIFMLNKPQTAAAINPVLKFIQTQVDWRNFKDENRPILNTLDDLLAFKDIDDTLELFNDKGITHEEYLKHREKFGTQYLVEEIRDRIEGLNVESESV